MCTMYAADVSFYNGYWTDLGVQPLLFYKDLQYKTYKDLQFYKDLMF